MGQRRFLFLHPSLAQLPDSYNKSRSKRKCVTTLLYLVPEHRLRRLLPAVEALFGRIR